MRRADQVLKEAEAVLVEGDPATAAQIYAEVLAADATKIAALAGLAKCYMATGAMQPFAVNREGRGPATRVGGAGLERPVAARFSPDGRSLYVVDFGVMMTTEQGPVPQPGTGVLWRIWRDGGP